MTKENKFKIGLCLQEIALSMDDATLERNRERLKLIEDIIAGDQEPRWIHANERLPEPNQIEKHSLTAKYYLVQNEYGDMMVARWDGKGWEQMYQYEYVEDEVIAWMPLPEPYKAESEGVECQK